MPAEIAEAPERPLAPVAEAVMAIGEAAAEFAGAKAGAGAGGTDRTIRSTYPSGETATS